MLYMMKRPSGGRGEYEIAGATDMYSAADLQDHEVVVSFGAGINLATGAILRLDSGKLRLRIERGDMHIHRQLAAALLMPRPRREESRLVPSVDSAIADRNYVLRRVTFDAAVLDGATAVVTPGSLETDSRSYVGSQSFTDRWSRVRYVVENRTSLEASIADALSELFDRVLRAAPLTRATEDLVQTIMAATSVEVPGYDGAKDVLPVLEGLIQGEDAAPDAVGAPEVSEVMEMVASAAGRPGRGQGFRTSAEQRKAVEARAMEVAINHYSELGWSLVEDVSLRASYDLHCYRDDGSELLVEVKGTTSDGSAVLLTPNEVTLARDHAPETCLFVVSQIVLDRDGAGAIVASGGEAREIEPWIAEEDRLTPTGFKYQLPVT